MNLLESIRSAKAAVSRAASELQSLETAVVAVFGAPQPASATITQSGYAVFPAALAVVKKKPHKRITRAKSGEVQGRVLAAVNATPQGVETIAKAAGLPVSAVRQVVLRLSKSGALARAGRGQYQRAVNGAPAA